LQSYDCKIDCEITDFFGALMLASLDQNTSKPIRVCVSHQLQHLVETITRQNVRRVEFTLRNLFNEDENGWPDGEAWGRPG
jgi:hypothetical protein